MLRTIFTLLLLVSLSVEAREFPAEIIRVVDGDTVDAVIDLGFNISITERIRLEGIDAPEIRTSDQMEKMRGHEAAHALTVLIGDGNVVIESDGKRGKFGRVLGVIVKDGLNLNQKLLNEGFVDVYE